VTITIENVNIDITLPSPSSPFNALFGDILAKSASAPRASAVRGLLSPPAIGEIWAGQGGIYVGLSRGEDGQPDAHLVLHVAESNGKLDWEGAKAWAAAVDVDGHADFRLPTRTESALLYANSRDLMDTDDWYWTGTQCAGNESCAWCQLFDDGDQLYNRKSYEARARAVRRLTT
jgi:hypothetical protein